MATNRWQLRADLRVELKKDPNGKIWSDSALNSYINKSYLKVQKDGNFAWRENQAETSYTSANTQEEALPTDFGKIELIRYNGTELYKTTKVSLKRQYTTFVNGTPSKYYINWANIGFDVIPNNSGLVDISYLKRLTSFTSDTDESEFNDDFDTAIVKYAAFLAWSSLDGKQQTARFELEEYGIEIDTLVSSYIFDDINDLTMRLQRTGARVTQADVLDR